MSHYPYHTSTAAYPYAVTGHSNYQGMHAQQVLPPHEVQSAPLYTARPWYPSASQASPLPVAGVSPHAVVVPSPTVPSTHSTKSTPTASFSPVVDVVAWIRSLSIDDFDDAIRKVLAPENRNRRRPYMVASMEKHIGDYRIFARWDETRPGPDGHPTLISLAVVTPPDPKLRKVYAEVTFQPPTNNLPGVLMRQLLVHAAKHERSIALGDEEGAPNEQTTVRIFPISWDQPDGPRQMDRVAVGGSLCAFQFSSSR